jgi:dTDP-4-dehydrorhamnose 3,5-epimerase-like enzyme
MLDSRPVIHQIQVHYDDRGSVYCVLDDMEEKIIKRTYVVNNFSKGLIRAWHGHRKGFTGLHVIRGAAKLIGRSMDDLGDMTTVVLSEHNPGVFWVPPGFYNGAVSLCDNTKILVYSTLTFAEVKGDDFRRKLTRTDRELFRVVDR